MKAVCLSLLFFAMVLAAPVANAVQWVPGGGESCLTACTNAGHRAVETGQYVRNNNPYFVCRTNVSREGKRPGYNLQPSWSSSCTVGHGGKEISDQRYECLCE